MRKQVSKKCFLCKRSYTDFETGERVTLSDYVKDVPSLVAYMEDFQNECYFVSADEYRCREDLEIKIKQVYLPEKKYVSLFY